MITEDPILVTIDLPSLIPMTDRSPGRHVSEIISELCVTYGHYDATKDTISPVPDRGIGGVAVDTFLASLEPRARMIIELGCTFESALIQRRSEDDPGRFIQPGEQTKDGLHGTPDLFALDYAGSIKRYGWSVPAGLKECRQAVAEVKLTYMSSERGPRDEKLWRYWVQLGAYCYMMGVRWGVLCVLYMRGDYGREDHPQYREWVYEFSRGELEGNWAMLMAAA